MPFASDLLSKQESVEDLLLFGPFQSAEYEEFGVMGYIQMRLCYPQWQNQDFMVKVITQLLSKQGGLLNLRVLSAAVTCLQRNCIDALIKKGVTSMPLPGFLTSNQISNDLLQKLMDIV
jgi:hypothetical protein